MCSKMATQRYRIVSGADSKIHDEPHIEGGRITVRDVHARVEQWGLSPERVAERYDLNIADVYEALAYYHSNPETTRHVGARHERAAADAKRRSSLQLPDS